MSQHFLLSPQAKTLSVKQVYKMTDGEVFETFKKIRFSEDDRPAPGLDRSGRCSRGPSPDLARRASTPGSRE